MSVDFNIDEFKEFLKIDKDDLDSELIRQADLFFRVSHAYALAVSRKDEASERLKALEAETSLAIRRSFEEEGKKATESLIVAHIKTDPAYKQASLELLSRKKEMEELDALKGAFSSRAYMLRDLVQLYVSEYYLNTSMSAPPKTRDSEKSHRELRDKMAAARRKSNG